MSYCRDICSHHYPLKIDGIVGKHNWARQGFKMCSKCEFLIITDDFLCKCCGIHFRTRMQHQNKKEIRKAID